VIAQNEATCVVYGMPRAVVEAHLANHVLPIENIATEIATYF
jgi:two-component system chemotaxis response regulator CheB